MYVQEKKTKKEASIACVYIVQLVALRLVYYIIYFKYIFAFYILKIF
jgi:hypothetical protein